MKVILRQAVAEDAAVLETIEQEAFPDPSWTAEGFLYYGCTVAVVGEDIAGFIVSRQTYEGSAEIRSEREILNLAVRPAFRRSGVASRLLEAEISTGTTLFLEVRESNLAAIYLYKKQGFVEVLKRPGYYSGPSESAIVMRLK